MFRIAFVLLVTAALAAPAASHAGGYELGYEGTSATADAVESHSADTVYWSPEAAKADGQLRYVSIWGSVVRGGGTPHFRFVVLHPRGDGTVEVEQVDPTVRSLAINGDPNYRNPNKNINWSLCFHKGDHLGLWKLGHGNLQIFRSAPGSLVNWYENAAGIAKGNVFAPTLSADRELLMQVLIETGRDAFDHCPGGYENHLYEGLELPKPNARMLPAPDVARLHVRCPASAYGGCFGRLVMSARIGGSRTTLGSVPFSFRSGKRGTLRVPIHPDHAALVRRRGSLNVRVVMKSHDDPSDARNRRAPGRRPGRQSHQSEHQVVLRTP